MTPEQREARRISTASGRIHELRDVGKNGKPYIVDKDAGVPYVFISYKSDDWETVLDGIVYTLCKKYGMRAYFDTKFEQNSDSWIHQFEPNMNHSNCRAIVAFTDNVYYESYATLMEVMASQTDKNNEKTFINVPLSTLTETPIEKSSEDTGLGTWVGKTQVNELWEIEKSTFDRLYEDLKAIANTQNTDQSKKIIRRFRLYTVSGQNTPFNENSKREPYLTKGDCYKIMDAVLPKGSKPQGTDAESRADSIHTMLINDPLAKDVFDESMIDWPPQEKSPVSDADKPPVDTKGSEENRNPIPINTVQSPAVSMPELPTLAKILDSKAKEKKTFMEKMAVRKGEPKSYDKIALIGKPGFEKYSQGPAETVGKLVIGFATARIAEMGEEYIRCVISYEAPQKPKDPIFITSEEFSRRKADEKANSAYDPVGFGYYIRKKYGNYDFLNNSLKKQLAALSEKEGLQLSEILDNILVDCTWKDAPKPKPAPDNKADVKAVPSEPKQTPNPSVAVAASSEVSSSNTVTYSLDYVANELPFGAKEYTGIRLIGKNGCEDFSTEVKASARDMVDSFVNTCVDKLGVDYIKAIIEAETIAAGQKPKNPIFLDEAELQIRQSLPGKISNRPLTSKNGVGYYMNVNFGDHPIIKAILVKQLKLLKNLPDGYDFLKQYPLCVDNFDVELTNYKPAPKPTNSGKEAPKNEFDLRDSSK